MNRVITGRLGLLSFLVVLFAAGCAVEQSTGDEEADGQSQDSDIIAAPAETAREPNTPTAQMVRHIATSGLHSACAGCGPLPDPWQMGPLPDPWSSSSGGTKQPTGGVGSSSSGGGVGSSSGSSGSSGEKGKR